MPPSLTLRGDYRGVPQTGRGSFGLLVQLASEWLGSPSGEATLLLRLAERVGETACKALLCALRASLQRGGIGMLLPTACPVLGQKRAACGPNRSRMYVEASAPRIWPYGLPWASWRDTFDTLAVYVTEWKALHAGDGARVVHEDHVPQRDLADMPGNAPALADRPGARPHAPVPAIDASERRCASRGSWSTARSCAA